MYCFAKFCRLCLQRSDSLVDIKSEDCDNIAIIHKIKTVMPSLIIINEDFPSLICNKCLDQLNNSFDFVNNCFKTNEQLNNYSLQLNFDKTPTSISNLNIHLLEEQFEIKPQNEDDLKINPSNGDDFERNPQNEVELQRNPEVDLELKPQNENLEIKPANKDLEIKPQNEDELELKPQNEDLEIKPQNEDELEKKLHNEVDLGEQKLEVSSEEKPDEKGYFVTINVAPNFGDDPTKQNIDDDNRIYIVNISNNLTENGDNLQFYEGFNNMEGKIHSGGTHEATFSNSNLNGLKTNIGEHNTPIREGLIQNTPTGEGLTPNTPIKEECDSPPSKKKKKEHVCASCDKKFVSKPNLRRHFESIHLKIRYSCKVCGKNFSQLETMLYHERVIHLNLRNHECNYCKKSYGSHIKLKSHLERCKRKKQAENARKMGNSQVDLENINRLEMSDDDDDDPPLIIDETLPSEQFRCPKCKRIFGSELGLKNHYKLKHCIGRHKCDECQLRFVLFRDFQIHKKNVHPKTRKRFKCDMCNDRFKNKTLLAEHHRKHEVEACTMCPKFFPDLPMLGLHYKHEHNVEEGRINDLLALDKPEIEEVFVDEVEMNHPGVYDDGDNYLLPD